MVSSFLFSSVAQAQVAQSTPPTAGQVSADAAASDGAEAFQKGNEAYERQDYAEARTLLRKGADQGNAPAQNLLGTLYENGLGGPKDEKAAARLYKLAADQGNPFAQANFGALYANGSGGLPKDEREARRLFTLAADQGVAEAQFNLGVLYENGRGGAVDYREAARLYKLAADQGMAAAQFNLGNFYTKGRGVQKNRQEAARLLKLAADQAYPDAQHNLDLLLNTSEVAQDDTTAKAALQFLQRQLTIDVSVTGAPEPGLARFEAVGGDMCHLRCGFHFAVGTSDVSDIESEFAIGKMAPGTLKWELDRYNRALISFKSAAGTPDFRGRSRTRKVDLMNFVQKPLSDWTKWSEWKASDTAGCRAKPDKTDLQRVVQAFVVVAASCGAQKTPF
jgi:TPR repeat protein